MTAKQPLLLIGAGGSGREVASLVSDLDAYEIVGFLDDDPETHGRSFAGHIILGPIDMAADTDALVVVTTGNPGNFSSRRRIVERLSLARDRYATLVHPSSTVGVDCVMGVGVVLQAGCVLTAGVHVGDHVLAMPLVVLTHDDRVGDYATFGAGSLVAGRVTVGAGAYVGSGARIREDLTIGEGSMVGMGSVVITDIPERTVWAGVPATQLRP